MISEVVYFNRELLGVVREKPKVLSGGEFDWLYGALTEELWEFDTAHGEQDLPGSVDSLLDLIYFAIGGLHRLGLSEAQISASFQAVHQANLTKRRGVKASRPQDGTVADAVKPEGFTNPEEKIREILGG